jgi:hypothetical protein
MYQSVHYSLILNVFRGRDFINPRLVGTYPHGGAQVYSYDAVWVLKFPN